MKPFISTCITLLICLTPSCESDVQKQVHDTKPQTTYVTTVQKMASDGLNLQAVTDLATKVKSAQEFEQELNKPNNPINNLDLNEDNTIDFIKITEINNDTGKGFSLTTEVAPNDEQELAVIQFEVDEATQQATVQTTGNPQVYGNHHHYHNRMGLTDVLIWGYFLRNMMPYSSPWGYNRYPDYHQRRQPMSPNSYRGYHQSQPYSRDFKSSTRTVVKQPVQSPNYNKTAKQIKAPLKNPTESQRSFQKLNPSRSKPTAKGFGQTNKSSSVKSPAKGTGFGQSRTTSPPTQRSTYSRSSSGNSFSTKPSARYGSSRTTRSRSSFGGGK